jgi:hypothetical protein
MRIFINGAYIYSKVLSADRSGDNSIQIGSNMGTENWTGSIDDVMIFSGALTTGQVLNLYRTYFNSGDCNDSDASIYS